MSIQMNGKDYAVAGSTVVSVTGGNALLGDILFRLSARRGSFTLMPELGSRMYLLCREKTSNREALARQYAVEALEELADVTVTDVTVTPVEEGLRVQVEVSWHGESLAVELEV